MDASASADEVGEGRQEREGREGRAGRRSRQGGGMAGTVGCRSGWPGSARGRAAASGHLGRHGGAPARRSRWRGSGQRASQGWPGRVAPEVARWPRWFARWHPGWCSRFAHGWHRARASWFGEVVADWSPCWLQEGHVGWLWSRRDRHPGGWLAAAWPGDSRRAAGEADRRSLRTTHGRWVSVAAAEHGERIRRWTGPQHGIGGRARARPVAAGRVVPRSGPGERR